jgi:ribosomal protein S21
MPIELKRKENEPLNSFLFRFNRAVRQSGILKQSRTDRFLVPKQSRNQRRKSALYRAGMKQKISLLKKKGVLRGGEKIGDIKKMLRDPKRKIQF